MALTRRQREILDFIAAFIGQKRYSPSLEEIAAHFGLSSVATVHKHVSNLERKGFIRRSWNRSRSIDLLATELPAPATLSSAALSGAILQATGVAESVVPFSARDRARGGSPLTLVPSRVAGAAEAMNAGVGDGSDARLAAVARLPLLGRVAAGRPIEAVTSRDTIAVPSVMVGRHPCYVLQVTGSSMIGDHIQDGDFVIVEQRETATNGEKVIALIGGDEATLKTYQREPDGTVRLIPANPEHQVIVVRDGEFRIQGVVIGVMRKYRA